MMWLWINDEEERGWKEEIVEHRKVRNAFLSVGVEIFKLTRTWFFSFPRGITLLLFLLSFSLSFQNIHTHISPQSPLFFLPPTTISMMPEAKTRRPPAISTLLLLLPLLSVLPKNEDKNSLRLLTSKPESNGQKDEGGGGGGGSVMGSFSSPLAWTRQAFLR